jgi:hypothetical protein
VYSERDAADRVLPFRLHPARPFGGGLGADRGRGCASASPR